MAIKVLTDVVVFSSFLDGTRETFIADRETLNHQVQDSPSKMHRHTELMRNIVLPVYSALVYQELPSNNYTV